MKLWYLSLATWGNNPNFPPSDPTSVHISTSPCLLITQWIISKLFSMVYSALRRPPPQPLPLSLFPVPHPLAMFSALWVLEPCFAPTLLCASLSTFLPGLISSPHTQSPALMPPAQTRLPELLSQAGPLFCSCIATCTYLCHLDSSAIL